MLQVGQIVHGKFLSYAEVSSISTIVRTCGVTGGVALYTLYQSVLTWQRNSRVSDISDIFDGRFI